jgi:hypothetical protein
MLRAQRLPGALESYGAETPAQLQTPAAYGNELAARSHIIMGWWALPVAKPGQPLVMDPRLQSLIDADSAHVLIPILGANRQIWANELDRHLAQQRAQHGCTDEEIMAVAIDELQRLTLPDSPHVDRWSVLFNAVSAEMFRRTGRKRRWYHRLP